MRMATNPSLRVRGQNLLWYHSDLHDSLPHPLPLRVVKILFFASVGSTGNVVFSAVRVCHRLCCGYVGLRLCRGMRISADEDPAECVCRRLCAGAWVSANEDPDPA